MKYLSLTLFLISFTAYGQSVSPEAFVLLNDEAKVEFLNGQAEEVDAQVLSPAERNEVVFTRLGLEALKISYVWSDTILEGPYQQTADAEIASAVVYRVGTQVYAYRFTVSAAAFFTEAEGCEYNDETDEWSEACAESAGHIQEDALFDFTGAEIEDDSYAEFYD